jgi:iron complex transport system ATP-binding protein
VALACERLALARGGRPVLAGIELALHAGEVLAVIGPNGSGKSTLVLAAAGLLEPAAGSVRARGEDLARLDPRARARLVAYVPQRSELVAPLAVRTVVAMGRYAADQVPGAGPGTAAAVDAALAAVDALHLAGRSFAELSGGEAQRVLLARALATGAGILLLDEPTSALDIGHRLALGALLSARARAGDAVLVALHDLSEARQLADRVALLHGGRLAALGPPDAVIAPDPVRAAYGVELVPGGGFGYRLPMP